MGAVSSIFSVIYGMALQARPEKANEISGLMITGVCGGGVIPPLMTWLASTFASDATPASQTGSILVLVVAVLYLIYCAYGLKPSVDNK